jgi:hypothetical protein
MDDDLNVITAQIIKNAMYLLIQLITIVEIVVKVDYKVDDPLVVRISFVACELPVSLKKSIY